MVKEKRDLCVTRDQISAIKGSHSGILALPLAYALTSTYSLDSFTAAIMDDDIQFLGMVSTVSPHRPYVHPSHPPLRPPASGASTNPPQTDGPITRLLTYPLIGIMLVIPKTGDEPTQTLRFLKSRSTVVHIGRASSSLADFEKSPDTIQFRCPVISRRHAKLMFSSGHVSPIIPTLSSFY